MYAKKSFQRTLQTKSLHVTDTNWQIISDLCLFVAFGVLVFLLFIVKTCHLLYISVLSHFLRPPLVFLQSDTVSLKLIHSLGLDLTH